jgi:hypothetical protein
MAEDTATPVGQIFLIPAQKFSFSISSLRIEQKIKPICLLARLLLLGELQEEAALSVHI